PAGPILPRPDHSQVLSPPDAFRVVKSEGTKPIGHKQKCKIADSRSATRRRAGRFGPVWSIFEVSATLVAMTNFLWRTLVIVHRYLGIAVGILMLLWFASGIVMMYVGFPRLTEKERASALAPIRWQACCRVADGLIPDDQQFYRVQIENLVGVP